MDRAWGIRVLCRPLLLAALAIQATTPYWLTDASSRLSLLPGPLSVVLDRDACADRGLREETFFPDGCFAISGATSADLNEAEGNLERHCKPYWPDVAAPRPRVLNPPERPKLRAEWNRAESVRIDETAAVAWRIPVARVGQLPLLLCRFLC